MEGKTPTSLNKKRSLKPQPNVAAAGRRDIQCSSGTPMETNRIPKRKVENIIENPKNFYSVDNTETNMEPN